MPSLVLAPYRRCRFGRCLGEGVMRDSSTPSTGSPDPSAAGLCARLPAEAASLPEVRSLLGRFLDERDVGDDVFYDALLVAHELTANAIRHGSGDDDEIELRARLLANRLCIVVTDAARRAAVPFALAPDEHREGGRGLQVVARLAEWSERIVGGRREVRAELPL
jgi:anti-sigma regulatory factor (Ser/Thr protein kinase)